MMVPSASSRQIQPRCPACGEVDFQILFSCSDRHHGLPGEFEALRCRGCGVVTSSPRLTDEGLGTYYPADYYAREPAPPPPPGWKTSAKRLLDEVHLGLRKGLFWRLALAPALYAKRRLSHATHLLGVPPGRLLDVGCGDAAFLEKARLMGFACRGVEPGARPWPNLEKRGVRVVKSADLDEFFSLESDKPPRERAIIVHSVPLEALRGGEGMFDLISLNHSLEHFQDPGAALDDVLRLLAPGGRVLVRMPDTDSVAFRGWPLHWPGLQIPRHVFLFNRENFRLMAERHGFEVVASSKEMAPVHWQWALKSKLLGKIFAEPVRWIDSPALTLALLPVADLCNALGWSDMMVAWLRPAEGSAQRSGKNLELNGALPQGIAVCDEDALPRK
jgi:SAM-dependent methyltransferase